MSASKRPYRPIPPGEILKEELEARGWTQVDFAEIIGRPLQAINEIIAGKKSITPETALVFSEAFGTSAEFWLNLESSYRLDLLHQDGKKAEAIGRKARLYSLAPVKELVKRGWIQSSQSIDELESAICGFLGIAGIEAPITVGAKFRKSNAVPLDSNALLAWVKKAETVAAHMKCGSFSAPALKNELKTISCFSRSDELTRQIPTKLLELGIRLVLLEHLPQTRVDGATFWLDEKSPVIALSLRIDRIDNFWFTLVHELVHVVDTTKTHKVFIDSDISEESEDQTELRVNREACNFLIPPRSFQSFEKQAKPYFSRSAVLSFARELGVHPAIIVGRLQHEKLIPYTNLRNLITKVRTLFADRIIR